MEIKGILKVTVECEKCGLDACVFVEADADGIGEVEVQISYELEGWCKTTHANDSQTWQCPACSPFATK